MTKMYRQGDILIEEIEKLPTKALCKKSAIIVEGEATGHAHRIVNGFVFDLPASEPRMFLKANQNSRIIHNEHLPIELEPGLYEVIRQYEYLGPGIKWLCCH